MSISLEYESFLDCVPKLRLSVKANLLELSGELLAARLISPAKESSLRNRNVDEKDRAADLVSLVLDKIEEDSANYHEFVNILKNDEPQYNTMIELLEKAYRARRNGGSSPSSLPLQDHSNGQSAPVIVKPKPVVDAESVHPSKSVADSFSQPPSDWSSIEHQPHLAFGASCGCKVCKNDLGCPKPITAETAFPLLEHMEGLDKIQKEDLHTRLRMETKDINLQFYNLLSNFFKSLKERNIPVNDLKTHLMALEAFDDDDQHRSVFYEQTDKLEKASTINNVFDVIKVFCSFFNYGLIQHLINIVGSDEDKARFEEYESKFTEYAKRRIYECPPKTAVCTAQHCDMYMKLESRFSEKCSLNDLRELHYALCKLLKVSQHVLRLCCIEKGCIKLTFQIPHFVKQRVFPLTLEQERALVQLNVTNLTCGDYEFPNKEYQENSLGNDSHTHSRVIARSCLDCSSSSGEIPLLCGGHFICSDCLVNRTNSIVVSKDLLVCNTCSQVTSSSESKKTHTYRDAVLLKQCTDTKLRTGEQQLHQKPQTQPQPARAVWIFVNDSNIWIEAKKLQSKQKMFKTSEDHRVRMDMGKLADVLAKGRPIRQGQLYGSEPPRIDTVWEKIREQGWEVHTSQRTSRHGKERLLTSTFVVDVVSLAEKTLPDERSTIILVSGDSSIIPAIEKVIEVDGWNVEIYMWSHATSRKLQHLQQKHRSRIAVSSLDPYYNDVTFTNMRFDCSNKNFLEMAKKSSVVFTVDPDSSSFPNHIPTDQWMSKLEELAQWPCQYYWYNNPENEQNKLVIVFKQDVKAGLFNVQNFLEKIASGQCQISSVIGAQSFPDFTSTEQLDRSGGHFEQIGLFDHQDAPSGFHIDSVYVTNSINAQVTKWNTQLEFPWSSLFCAAVNV